MAAYYNEFDPFSAQWLRELIKAGRIASGEVDERSIADVRPDDLVGFTQCHFFAGIGVWSYAMRLAGWGDTRPVWTGSCPCQPFSAAGKGAGNADERHLWPVFFELIRACRPPVVLGEQVASAAVIGSAAKRRVVAPSCGTVGAGDERVWLDAVFDDLEAAHYTCGAVSFPACGVGSPHIRQRLYWMAHRDGARHQELQPAVNREVHQRRAGVGTLGGSERGEPDGWLADHGGERLEGWRGVPERASKRAIGQDGVACWQPDPGPTNSQWRDVDWLFCRDGKWRPVVATHVALVDGPSSGMVRVCHEGADQEKEEVVHEYLYPLRQRISSETLLQRDSGVAVHVGPQEVLQQNLHGRAHEERNMFQPEPQQNEGSQHGSGCLRDMRIGGGPASPSCGREPAEQCAVELEDVVSLLSPSLSLAEFHENRRTAEALHALRQSICEKGVVRGASEPVEKVWASLGEEEKNSLRLDFDASRWQKLVAFPLENNAVNRVGRLRGYGNAIVAQQAAAFIGAVMEEVGQHTGGATNGAD